MADYIERKDAYKAIEECWEGSCGEYDASVITHDTIEALDSIPSADVQPVVHGEWIKARGSWCTPGGDPVWECSECGKGMHVYGIEHGTYGSDVADGQWVACPNCGARMDKDKEQK